MKRPTTPPGSPTHSSPSEAPGPAGNPPDLSEEGLDPDDWDSLRRLGHRMVDDLVAFHSGLSEGPAWQSGDTDPGEGLALEFPQPPIGAEEAYEVFLRRILPYHYSNIHPRGWGWVNGTGTTLGAFAEMMAAGMNPNTWGGRHGAAWVENAVMSFFREVFQFPDDATGLLLSGGSVANLVALAAAREAAVGGTVSASGLRASERQLTFYTSERVHNSVDKAVGILGVGWEYLRKVPTDDAHRLDLDALARAVAEDRERGLHPACVVATAGTVDTGSIDPLDDVAELCRSEGLWMHVDGAFGGLLQLSAPLRPLVRGIERADSIAFDLHKWLHAPIEAGCVLVRHPDAHRRPFSPPAPYLRWFDRGVASGPDNYAALGPQLTRGFRALKVWMSLKAHGSEVYGRLIEQNVRQARYLEERVLSHPDLEMMAPTPLNICCFRYRPGGVSEADANAANVELLMRLHESGIAVLSSTEINERFTLRASFTNHRTRRSDIDGLVEATVALGREILEEAEPGMSES